LNNNIQYIQLLDGWTTEAAIIGGELTTKEDIEKFVHDSVTTDKLTLLFAIQRDEEGKDKAIVGTITIVPFPDLEENPTPGEAMITRFAVHSSYQSKGLGRLLIEDCLKVMKQQGCERCSLRVFENRPEVLAWYTKLGFKDTLERRAYKPLPGKVVLQKIDFVIMKKDL
jgi:ribosomal protein S18 acetylase RimI-like enzyme